MPRQKKIQIFKGMLRLRVAIIQGVMSPYRHPLFERLSKRIDLTVFYCSVKSSYRKWDLWPRKYYYKYRILPRIPLGNLYVNPSIVKRLILDRPGVLVLGGGYDLTFWFALAISKLLKVPTIYWTEGIKEPRSILGITSRPLRMLFMKKSSAIVVPGRLSRNYVISLGADAEKVFIAPNAIDNELFINISQEYRSYKRVLKARLGFENKIVILYIGRLIKEKNITFLIEAYRKIKSKIKDITLIIVGYGKQYNMLKELCEKKQIDSVVFTGSIENCRNLIKYYSIADIFVLPTALDVWGIAINEAMACGLPIISTRTSQAALEMINHGENGYIIKEGDLKELHIVLEELVFDKKLRKKMAKRSMEIVMSRFDLKHMVGGFMKAINYIIKGYRAY